jgi:hypothetical protein
VTQADVLRYVGNDVIIRVDDWGEIHGHVDSTDKDTLVVFDYDTHRVTYIPLTRITFIEESV